MTNLFCLQYGKLGQPAYFLYTQRLFALFNYYLARSYT